LQVRHTAVYKIFSSNIHKKLVTSWGKETEAVRGTALSGVDNTAENMVTSWISSVSTLPVQVPGYFEGACAELTLECHSTAH
jgi:hypothetical protein